MIAILEEDMQGWTVLLLPALLSGKQYLTSPSNTGGIGMLLLLFDTHAGEFLNDYSHLKY